MKRKKKLHIIGLCGKGTSAVAVLMKEKGWEISGSDSGFYEPIASYIKKNKLSLKTPYSSNNIPKDVDMILMGSTATLSPENNTEVKHAYNMNVPIFSFAEILSTLTENTHNIVVAGSYGKSTCTSLLSYYLIDNKKDPSYFIGAIPLNLDKSSHLGKGKYFILEGDEYPHKIDDISSKFLFYNTNTLLLTSGEHDHINKFPDIASYLSTYKELVSSLNNDSLIVCAIHHPNVAEIIKHSKAKVITYGLNNAYYTAKDIKYGKITSFTLLKDGKKVGIFETSLLGSHNIENIIGTAALVLERKILTINELIDSVKKFNGLKRRLDLKIKKSSIPVYEGFGSSYTKAKTALEAIRLHFHEKRIITVFEPHTFGWRNRGNLSWYRDVFQESDIVFIYTPPKYGASTHDQLSFDEIIKESKKYHQNIYPLKEEGDFFAFINEKGTKNDIILILSSGSMGGMIESIPKFFENK